MIGLRLGLGLGSRSGSWSPSQLSNVLLDLNADIGFTASQWNDQSGNGLHAVQATGASQPALVAAWTNGQPAVNFASSKRMTCGTNVLAAGAARTILVVGQKADASSVTNFGAYFTFKQNTPAFCCKHQKNGTPAHSIYSDNATNEVALSSNILTTIESPFQSVLACAGTGNQVAQYVNGTLRALAGGSSAMTSDSGASAGYIIGDNAFSQFWNGHIARLVVLSGVISAGDRALWDAWVTSKYGI